MHVAKRKISVSVDEDLLAELERVDLSISSQMNLALREQVERRRRQSQLTQFLDHLDGEHGPVDEALVEKYARLLE